MFENGKRVYKKEDRSDKDNYRPVSILPNCQKFLKGVYVNKFLHFLRISFLSINAGLGKSSAHHCLLALIEKWKQSMDHGIAFGALLTDLSKAFDCLPHYLFIEK